MLAHEGACQDHGCAPGWRRSKESDRKTYKTLGWVGYGVGAACIATGALLYCLGQQPGSAGAASVAFIPAFAPGQAGAILMELPRFLMPDCAFCLTRTNDTKRMWLLTCPV